MQKSHKTGLFGHPLRRKAGKERIWCPGGAFSGVSGHDSARPTPAGGGQGGARREAPSGTVQPASGGRRLTGVHEMRID